MKKVMYKIWLQNKRQKDFIFLNLKFKSVAVQFKVIKKYIIMPLFVQY